MLANCPRRWNEQTLQAEIRHLEAAEIDRVRRALEIYVPPCRVLLIDNPAIMLETAAIDRASGIFIPLHLVVSGAGNRTLVHMLNLEHIRHSDRAYRHQSAIEPIANGQN